MADIGEVQESEEGVFEWTVKDFMSLSDQVDDGYVSPLFSFGGRLLYFRVYPNGQRNNPDGYIYVYVENISFSHGSIKRKYSLGLKTAAIDIDGVVKTFDGYGIRFRRSLLLERQLEIAPSGHLTIVCRMKSNPSTEVVRDRRTSGSVVESKIKYFETIELK